MEKFSLSSNEGYTAEVYQHGCHVTKWCEPDGTVSPVNELVRSSQKNKIFLEFDYCKGPALI